MCKIEKKIREMSKNAKYRGSFLPFPVPPLNKGLVNRPKITEHSAEQGMFGLSLDSTFKQYRTMNLRVTFSFQNGNLFCYICRFTNFLYTYVYLPTYVVGVFHKQVKNYSRFILTSVRNCLHDGYLKVELYMVHIYVLIVIDLAGIPNLSFSRGNGLDAKFDYNFLHILPILWYI